MHYNKHVLKMPSVPIRLNLKLTYERLKWMFVVDKCIVELADKQAFSDSAGRRRFQCLAVCLRGKSSFAYNTALQFCIIRQLCIV